jgi:lysozyme
MKMTVLDRAIDRAKQEEGFCGKAYRCPAGKITIGYGHNCEDSAITRMAAEFILHDDLICAEQTLWSFCPEYAALDEVRQSVLLDMCFNMGWGSLSKFVKMFEAIRKEDWKSAANEIVCSAYGMQVVLRSDRNAKMMLTGQYVD